MLVTFLSLLPCFQALAAAQANGGDPADQPVDWQAGDDHRGTWDITSSCLSTILACTWSIQHLNVPGTRQDGRKWSLLLRSIKWMVITILFPELIVLHAMFEFAMALDALRLMEQDDQKQVALPWWLPPRRSSSSSPPPPPPPRHSHLLRRFMRSLSCSGRQKEPADLELQPIEDDRKWTLTHCFFANMGGFYHIGQQTQFPVTALQLAKEKEGFERPSIKKEGIEDKSKQDWFAKGVATLQFLQLALSVIVRSNQGLAFSQLETITLGFAVCGAVIYLVYLYKPQGVGISSPLTRWSESPQSESTQRAAPTDLRFKKTYDSFWDVLMNEQTHADVGYAQGDGEILENIPERIPNDNIPISRNAIAHPAVFLLAFASALFGAMHAIAWHFEFPTTAEKILWQTATVVAAGTPVLGLVTIPLAQWTVSAGDPQLFLRNCLRLMREYSWYTSEKDLVDAAYEELENVLATKPEAKRPFDSIFSREQDHAQTVHLVRQLRKFLEVEDHFGRLKTQPLNLQRDEEFKRHFRHLVAVLEGRESKKLNESATTNIFPRKHFFHKTFNRGILYVTTLLYCLSRLSLLAVAFSSLRKMPESVYINTPWTAYIPTLSSGG